MVNKLIAQIGMQKVLEKIIDNVHWSILYEQEDNPNEHYQ